jgi:hydroxyacylglutathione hydrolase
MAQPYPRNTRREENNVIHEIIPVGPLQCNCHILGDETTREAMVVDPGDDIPLILAALSRHHLTLRQIVITHAHIDHIAGAQTLKQLTGAPILYNQLDLPLVALMESQANWLGVPTPEVRPPDADLPDLQTLHIATIPATVLHTPGHSPGSISLHLPTQNLVLSGDHLPTLLHSIHDRLLTLPGTTRVYPGHGPATTIEAESEDNPFLQAI